MANGQKQVVIKSDYLNGYFELTTDNNWQAFQYAVRTCFDFELKLAKDKIKP
ncbi:MAG: hypothetical protein AAF806_18950 [Bacteroidota bacterium]